MIIEDIVYQKLLLSNPIQINNIVGYNNPTSHALAMTLQAVCQGVSNAINCLICSWSMKSALYTCQK